MNVPPPRLTSLVFAGPFFAIILWERYENSEGSKTRPGDSTDDESPGLVLSSFDVVDRPVFRLNQNQGRHAT